MSGSDADIANRRDTGEGLSAPVMVGRGQQSRGRGISGLCRPYRLTPVSNGAKDAPLLTEGVIALNNAERQRRYIARLKAAAKAVSNAPSPSPDVTRLKRELAQAKAKIAKQAAEIVRLRTSKPVRKPAT